MIKIIRKQTLESLNPGILGSFLPTNYNNNSILKLKFTKMLACDRKHIRNKSALKSMEGAYVVQGKSFN
ncbi:MAG: hypothetical protein R6V76_14355 [Desulfobacterales bacterium]